MLLCLFIQRVVLNSFACNFQKEMAFCGPLSGWKKSALNVELTIPLLIFAAKSSMLLLAYEHLGSLSATATKAVDYKLSRTGNSL